MSYFAPDMRAAPVTGVVPDLRPSAQIFVVGSFNFSGARQADATTRKLLSELGRTRHLNAVLNAPNVTVWEYS